MFSLETNRIFGIPVVVSPLIEDEPKFVLSEKLQSLMSKKDIESFNEWSKSFFGIKYTFFSFGGDIYCSMAGHYYLQHKLLTSEGAKTVADLIDETDYTPNIFKSKTIIAVKPDGPPMRILRDTTEGLYPTFGWPYVRTN